MEYTIDREYIPHAQVDRVYVVQNEFGDSDDNPLYSIKEAISYLRDAFDTKDGKIFDAHTNELVGHVVKGKLQLP